jgi:hypothetical protein
MAGKIALLSALRSFETKKPFKLKDLLVKDAQLNFYADYIYGYLMASIALGIVGFSLSNEIWTITKVDSNLKIIEEIVAEDIKNGEKQSWYLFLKNNKQIIDNYFAEDVSQTN